MFYQAQFDFLQQMLTNLHLHYSVFPIDKPPASEIDLHLRESLGLTHGYTDLGNYFSQTIRDHMIYHITDSFSCRYSCLLLPDMQEKTMLIIGPYVTDLVSKPHLMQIIEKNALSPQNFPSCEKYFSNVPYMADHSILTVLLNTFGANIWGGMEQFSVEYISSRLSEDHSCLIPSAQSSAKENTLFDMQALEQRYALENEFLQAVSQGFSHKARMLVGNFPPAHTPNRSIDALSSLKYYLIVLNTLMRKAAENGSVHPLHIDQLSSDFAFRIDRCNSTDAGQRLIQEMIHKYCLLVKNHSIKGYSLLVQKVITRVDSDLTADLSLSAMANLLNVNASYLSNLFKKETGSTMTDYVNRKRIDHGILLLNSTALQIQTIAQYCGIPDVNYFTKLFKRYIGKTPKEYRDAVMHPGR